MRIRILSAAEEDLEEGFRFYESQSPGGQMGTLTDGDVGAKGNNNKHKSWHRVIKGVNWGHARTSETVRKMGCTGVSAARFLEMTELDG